jgi:flagellar M-ring protein FliF
MGRLLASLSVSQRITILLAVAAVGAGIYWAVRWQRESDFRQLYAGLKAEDAGEVVERLKGMAADYRLSEDGRAVLVPSARVAELRLTLAAAGLPRNGRIGFELFDKVNFGATEFSEQVNYRRALEGELERSVTSLAAVEQARVHLTAPKDSVFVETRQPAKASVLVKLRGGNRLTAQNVAAISHLVASAVDGLAPEAVSILDMQGNLLNRPRRPDSMEGSAPSEATLEYRQAMERDVVAKIANTLEPLLGADKFRASAALDCDFTSGEQSEESFDPARSVMLTSQKAEEFAGMPASAGVPGTASNLPRPTSRPSSEIAGLTRQTENVTYQSSRTVRRTRLPQGTVKRMSIAVLVDHDVKWAADGKSTKPVVEPPSAEKLKAIRDLTAAAVGLNAERGDQLIVESLPFEATLNLRAPEANPPAAAPRPGPAPGWIEKMGGQKVLIGAGAGGAVLLLAVVVVTMLRKKRSSVSASTAPELPPAQGERAVTGGATASRRVEAAAPHYEELPPVEPKKSDILAGRIRESIKQEPENSAQILRGWLSEEEE